MDASLNTTNDPFVVQVNEFLFGFFVLLEAVAASEVDLFSCCLFVCLFVRHWVS